MSGTQTASAAVGECVWTGGGSSDDFSIAANWSNCDGAGIPENGDSIALLTGVDSDTTDGDDRNLNNDISNLSLSGITVSGLYPEGDYDYYEISGNSITLTGDVVGGEADSYNKISLSVDITVSADIELDSVLLQGDLSAGNNALTVKESSLSGAFSGSGSVTINKEPGGAGGTCETGNAIQDYAFSGDNSGFSGSVRVISGGFQATSRTTDLARNASSITLEDQAQLSIILDAGKNMTFSVPIISNGGDVFVQQMLVTCSSVPATKTLTLTGSFTANQKTEFILSRANVKITGTVTGAKNIVVMEGADPNFTLTVNGVTSRSKEKTTTHYGNSPNDAVFVLINNIEIIAKGAVRGYTLIDDGILRGVGTVGELIMRGGRLEPGLSPGCLTSGDLTFEGGTLEIELAGNKVCDEYDQQIVNGTVDLGTKTKLDIQRLDGFTPMKNDVFVILKNDAKDAIIGNFSGLPDGDTVVVDGVTYRISYKGGDGNDVTLTAINVPEVPDTGFANLKISTIAPILSTVAMVGALIVAKKRLVKI